MRTLRLLLPALPPGKTDQPEQPGAEQPGSAGDGSGEIFGFHDVTVVIVHITFVSFRPKDRRGAGRAGETEKQKSGQADHRQPFHLPGPLMRVVGLLLPEEPFPADAGESHQPAAHEEKRGGDGDGGRRLRNCECIRSR